MAPICPNCSSVKTRTLNPPTMKKTKDYVCEECNHSWNRKGPQPG